MYGLPANATFQLSITGPDSNSGSRTADAHGVYASYLGSQWAPGAYTFNATWSGGTVNATATKVQ